MSWTMPRLLFQSAPGFIAAHKAAEQLQVGFQERTFCLCAVSKQPSRAIKVSTAKLQIIPDKLHRKCYLNVWAISVRSAESLVDSTTSKVRRLFHWSS